MLDPRKLTYYKRRVVVVGRGGVALYTPRGRTINSSLLRIQQNSAQKTQRQELRMSKKYIGEFGVQFTISMLDENPRLE